MEWTVCFVVIFLVYFLSGRIMFCNVWLGLNNNKNPFPSYSMGIPPISIQHKCTISVTLFTYLNICSPKISHINSNPLNYKYTYTPTKFCPRDFYEFIWVNVPLVLVYGWTAYLAMFSMFLEIISEPISPAPIVNNEVIFIMTFDNMFVYNCY